VEVLQRWINVVHVALDQLVFCQMLPWTAKENVTVLHLSMTAESVQVAQLATLSTQERIVLGRVMEPLSWMTARYAQAVDPARSST